MNTKAATEWATTKSRPPAARKRSHFNGGKGTGIIWNKGLEQLIGCSAVTRWRYERDGMLPARDAFINGKAVGWKPETIEAYLSGRTVP